MTKVWHAVLAAAVIVVLVGYIVMQIGRANNSADSFAASAKAGTSLVGLLENHQGWRWASLCERVTGPSFTSRTCVLVDINTDGKIVADKTTYKILADKVTELHERAVYASLGELVGSQPQFFSTYPEATVRFPSFAFGREVVTVKVDPQGKVVVVTGKRFID